MTAATCAFDRCQAGGVILDGAPVMSELLVAHNAVVYGVREYHPGCWEAARRLDDHPRSPADVAPSKRRTDA